MSHEVDRALVSHGRLQVTPPSEQATFVWMRRPPGGTFRGRAYTDGSLLDGPTKLLGRNGWAFVVLSFDDDSIIAEAYGVPPPWAEGIEGAEAWALVQAAKLAEPGTMFYGDCLPCLQAFWWGSSWALSESRRLARVY